MSESSLLRNAGGARDRAADEDVGTLALKAAIARNVRELWLQRHASGHSSASPTNDSIGHQEEVRP